MLGPNASLSDLLSIPFEAFYDDEVLASSGLQLLFALSKEVIPPGLTDSVWQSMLDRFFPAMRESEKERFINDPRDLFIDKFKEQIKKSPLIEEPKDLIFVLALSNGRFTHFKNMTTTMRQEALWIAIENNRYKVVAELFNLIIKDIPTVEIGIMIKRAAELKHFNSLAVLLGMIDKSEHREMKRLAMNYSVKHAATLELLVNHTEITNPKGLIPLLNQSFEENCFDSAKILLPIVNPTCAYKGALLCKSLQDIPKLKNILAISSFSGLNLGIALHKAAGQKNVQAIKLLLAASAQQEHDQNKISIDTIKETFTLAMNSASFESVIEFLNNPEKNPAYQKEIRNILQENIVGPLDVSSVSLGLSNISLNVEDLTETFKLLRILDENAQIDAKESAVIVTQMPNESRRNQRSILNQFIASNYPKNAFGFHQYHQNRLEGRRAGV